MMEIPLKKLEVLQQILREREESLCVAESCTGGLVSFWLSELPGSSLHFKGGVVSYATEVKTGLLGLDEKRVEEQGVVNKEAAESMALGVKKLLKTDWSLSVTGIAGPAVGSKGEPVGLVAFAVSSPFATKSCLENIKGKNRKEVRHQSALFALDFLLFEFKCLNKDNKSI